MAPPYAGANGGQHQQPQHGHQPPLTPTAMGRWSVASKQLPPVTQIKSLHVYDFDNTLFKTPLPNPRLWNSATIGLLQTQDYFANGGWWHDSRILAATGEGIAKEEPRAWDGWWNELIVELVRLSTRQQDALCVLLTGRAEAGFGELVKRIVAAKGLDFDMVCLKPAVGPNGERFKSTMDFKQVFLRRLMETYRDADDIRLYEDRPKHVKGFRDFFTEYEQKTHSAFAPRGPIHGDVIQVADLTTFLDPVVEVAEVHKIIGDHNAAVEKKAPGIRRDKLEINKTTFFTGYMIKPEDTKRLLALASIPPTVPEVDLKLHANNIMICPRPCPPEILEKVGGMGHKMSWAVTGTACLDNSLWAACLQPVPANAPFHTENPSPWVVLALRKGARPFDAAKIKNWQPIPPEKAFVFETTVGEKVLLRIESSASAHDGPGNGKSAKRKHNDDGPSGRYGNQRGGHFQNNNNNHHNQQRGGRGGFNNFRGGGFRGGQKGSNRGGQRGNQRGGRGGRGGGGGRHYHSLDDVGTREVGGGPSSAMYDDGPSPGQFARSNKNNGRGGGAAGSMDQYY